MKRKAIFLAITLTMATALTGCKSSDYKTAQGLVDEGNYAEAITILESLGDYKDSAVLLADCQAKQSYEEADAFCSEGNYEEAITIFEGLGDYEDSAIRLTDAKYQLAIQYQDDGKYDEAITLYKEIGSYQLSEQKIETCCYAKAEQFIADKKYDEALEAVADYQTSKEGKHYADICNVHKNGIEGLITYMKENLVKNSDGDYAKSVQTGKDNSMNVLLFVENDVLKMEISSVNHKSGDPLVTLIYSGKDAGSFKFRYSNLQKVSSSYAYYNGSFVINGADYAGVIVNAVGKIDFSKFKKDTVIDFSDIIVKDSSDSMTDEEREQYVSIAKGMMNPMGVFACEGLQQFVNEQDLRISIKELGIKKYKLQFAEDPNKA